MTPHRIVALAGLLFVAIVGWVATRPARPVGPLPPGPRGTALLIEPDPVILGRITQKQRVIDALLRGEVTLAEAAARFWQLNARDPAAGAAVRELYPGAGEDELAYRQVIHFAFGGPRPAPDPWAPRRRALEDEFHARFPHAAPFPAWARLGGPGPAPGQPGGVQPGPIPVQ